MPSNTALEQTPVGVFSLPGSRDSRCGLRFAGVLSTIRLRQGFRLRLRYGGQVGGQDAGQVAGQAGQSP